MTFFIQTFFIRDKVYTNFLYTGQNLYGTKFIRDKVYTGTKFIRGQSLYEDKVYTGQSLYGDKVYTGTKFIQTFFIPQIQWLRQISINPQHNRLDALPIVLSALGSYSLKFSCQQRCWQTLSSWSIRDWVKAHTLEWLSPGSSWYGYTIPGSGGAASWLHLILGHEAGILAPNFVNNQGASCVLLYQCKRSNDFHA